LPPLELRGSRQRLGFQLADPRALLATAPAVTDDAMYGYPERLLLGCLSGVSMVALSRLPGQVCREELGRQKRYAAACGGGVDAGGVWHQVFHCMLLPSWCR